jgi:hypothetical protein
MLVDLLGGVGCSSHHLSPLAIETAESQEPLRDQTTTPFGAPACVRTMLVLASCPMPGCAPRPSNPFDDLDILGTLET